MFCEDISGAVYKLISLNQLITIEMGCIVFNLPSTVQTNYPLNYSLHGTHVSSY